MLKTITTILILFSFVSIKAQNLILKDIKATEELSQKASTLFYELKISEAFEELSPYWPLPANEIDEIIIKTIRYLNILEDRFGQRIGIVKLKQETIADFAIRETYIMKYKYNGIRFIYTYYKNDEGWILNGFKWDDEFSKEFK